MYKKLTEIFVPKRKEYFAAPITFKSLKKKEMIEPTQQTYPCMAHLSCYTAGSTKKTNPRHRNFLNFF